MQKALYLPNISGKSLDTGATKTSTEMCFGKITILAMLGTRVSEARSRVCPGLITMLIQRPDQCQRLCRPRTCAVCFTSTLPICSSQPPGEYPQVPLGQYVPDITPQGDTTRPTIDIFGVDTKHGVSS